METLTGLYTMEEEAIPGVVIQVISWFLIFSSIYMFIKHSLIRTIDHLLHMNMLVASACFLLSDWALALPAPIGCEIYTFMFFVFGSAGTLSTVAIALERYRKMLRVSAALPNRKWQLLQLSGVWLFSGMLIIYPCFQKLRLVQFPGGDTRTDLDNDVEELIEYHDTLCMFSNSMMYADNVMSISFGVLTVLLSLFFITFFYTRIFKHVRSVRINRWLNHVAAQRGRQARVIKSHGRKANVFQVHMTPIASSDRNFDTIAYSRERSILFKGLFSLCVVIACWVPCSSLFIYLSTNGFDTHYVRYLKYVVLVAKLSVPVNIIHFICFNVRYRKLYGQSLIGVFRKLCPSYYTEAVENTSMADSHMAPTSLCYRDTILPTHQSGVHTLTPIIEPPANRNASTHDVIETVFTQSRAVTPNKPCKILQRTKSMPMCIKRGTAVAPIT